MLSGFHAARLINDYPKECSLNLIVARRLCERMQQAVVFADMHRPLPHVTASFGVACLAPGQTADSLIATADAALYRAKAGGRNQVAA